MDFVIRYSILTFIIMLLLTFAPSKWAKYNTWLMVGLLTIAGLIFIV